MTEIITDGEKGTKRAAEEIAKALKPGSFIALYGDLGAGKTAFTKGLAAALGIKERVLSPTFTLLKVYTSGRVPLYHFDVYRISDINDLADLGYYDLACGDGVCVTEWADIIESELPPDRLDVYIEYADGEDSRKIRIVPQGTLKGA